MLLIWGYAPCRGRTSALSPGLRNDTKVLIKQAAVKLVVMNISVDGLMANVKAAFERARDLFWAPLPLELAGNSAPLLGREGRSTATVRSSGTGSQVGRFSVVLAKLVKSVSLNLAVDGGGMSVNGVGDDGYGNTIDQLGANHVSFVLGELCI